MKLPISESLHLDIESKPDTAQPFDRLSKEDNPTMNQANQFMDEFRSKTQTSVFMDASNPLLSQVAIFGRLLEMSEKGLIEEEEKDIEQPAGESIKPVIEEKRTTRGASRKRE